MRESKALLQLQQLDIEILQAEKRLEDLPEKRAILEVRAKRREIAEMKAKAELLTRKLEAEVKARQDEVTLLTEKIDAEQAKIMATTDHRSIQTLTREMDGLKRRVDKLEMEEMQFLERLDKAQAQIAKVDEASGTLEAKEAALIDRFRAVGGEVQAHIAALKARRESVATAVGPPLLERYESIRSSRGGVGVGRLVGDTCTACRMSLPAERIKALRLGDDIGQCPQCRRLIVVRGEGDE